MYQIIWPAFQLALNTDNGVWNNGTNADALYLAACQQAACKSPVKTFICPSRTTIAFGTGFGSGASGTGTGGSGGSSGGGTGSGGGAPPYGTPTAAQPSGQSAG